MVKNKYMQTIKNTRVHLNWYDKLFSKVMHIGILDKFLGLLEKTLFRSTPVLIGLIASVSIGAFIFCVCYVFGYQIYSFDILFYTLILGFIVGAAFEYIRNFSQK